MRYYITAALFILMIQGVTYAQLGSVSYEHLTVRDCPVDVININMNDPHIKVEPVVSKQFPESPEDFNSMVSREAPVAAINGNFFCKNTYRPVGDIVIEGKLVHFGGLGTAMAITSDNKVEFIKVEKYRHMDWAAYKTVISCGPQLVKQGNVSLDPKGEGFHDPSLYAARNRSAVGVTWDNRLLFVTVNTGVYFDDLAAIMKDLGCRDAMNLDGGGSTGLYYKGQTISRPVTDLPDILVVQEQKEAPNFLISLSENKNKSSRVEVLSSLVIISDKDQFMVKGLKDGKVHLLVKLDSRGGIDATELGARIETGDNRVTIKMPIEKLRDLLNMLTPPATVNT